MKKFGMLILCSVALVACNKQNNQVDLKNKDQKASYAIGYRTGEQMEGQMGDLDVDAFLAGMRDGVKGNEKGALVKTDKMDDLIQDFQKRKMAEHKAKHDKDAKENKEKGEAFLKKNAKKDGVVTLDSGLQYKVLESGKKGAPSPTLDDTVKADYEGRLLSGKVFDSSIKRGKPATFPLNGVIKGWQIALPKMHVGDKWELYIPPKLAYGEHGAGGVIGPNEVLIFDVKLLGIEKGGDNGSADNGDSGSAAKGDSGAPKTGGKDSAK